MDIDADLQEVGRKAAEAVVGDRAIDRVEVRPGLSSVDEPTYEFYYRFDRGYVPSSLEPGDTLLFLTRHLREQLRQRGDPETPVVHLLNAAEWRRWAGD